MAIDSMLKMVILCPTGDGKRILRTLHGMGIAEMTDVQERSEDIGEHLAPPETSTEEIDQVLQKIHLLLGLIDTLAPEKKSFVAGLAPVPLVIEPGELDAVRQNFDLESHYIRAHELDAAYRRADRHSGEIQNQLEELRPFESLAIHVGDLAKTRHTRVLFGEILPADLTALQLDANAPGTLTVERLYEGKYYREGAPKLEQGTDPPRKPVQVLAAFVLADEQKAREALARHGFTEVSLPDVPGTIRDRIRELTLDQASLEEEVAAIRAGARDLARHRREILILKAFWDSCKNLALARLKCARGRWVQVMTGFIREKDAGTLKEALKGYDRAEVILTKPSPDEVVPISISLPKSVRPVRMLVDLFGLPMYGAFDPSPFVLFGFFLFFGMCFGDVGYGLMLLGISAYIMLRTKAYEGLYNFGKLLLMASIPTILFGFIFGSCFGDLYTAAYLGEGNPVERLLNATTLVNPVENPVVVLLMALLIGVLNQFYAIGLKVYSHVKQGDKATAVYDGVLWLIALPGFILLVCRMFATLPGWLNALGLVLFGVGALGLILTQGRDVKNPVGRFLSGVLSLYGIVGSYGITAFIGDTMSYCRLLALGLTTSIVAMSFNMIAGMVRDSLGVVPFILVLILVHPFNFLISVMGAFVHSMRLILVEFFGRFYEGGAKPFAPLGFDSEAAILRRE
jgi:V/A-type H+-transporting ATPase subunit I